MPRTVFPSGRKSLLLFVLAAVVIGGAWWWLRPPPEPVFQGTRLSKYLADDFKREGDARPIDRQLKSYGPAGVAWLAYKLEHGRRPLTNDRPHPLDNAPDWLRRWFPERWGGLRRSSDIDERVAAAHCLESLGPVAALAIPALARTMESDDSSLVDSVAEVFRAMGPAAWPAMREILDHGGQQARIVLFDQLYDRFGPGGKYAEPAVEAQLPSVVATFIRAFHDPDPKVRAKAAYSLGDCKELRDDDDLCYDPALPALLELLSDPNSAVSAQAAQTVGTFKTRATSAIPRLIEMLDDTDPPVRSAAGWALALIDTPEHSIPRLRTMLRDPDSQCRQAAGEALGYIDYRRSKESAGKAPMP